MLTSLFRKIIASMWAFLLAVAISVADSSLCGRMDSRRWCECPTGDETPVFQLDVSGGFNRFSVDSFFKHLRDLAGSNE